MIYLSERDIVKLNVIQIKRYSPKETIGVIDKNALSMAVNQPKQHIFGKDLYPDVFSKAAVLLINLIKKHPFHNANKRTAFLATYIFLKLNGYSLKMENQEVVEFVVRIATYQGEFDDLKEATTDILKNNSTKIEAN
ncbi:MULTISPECIES: type II toxin-antitoxin system death-on-curing family toxin [Enterococcus]|uniref:Type II toxin-antitoxin system death-on-curing family toxin n=1 Tax=Enterococcus casseliflavus TaxID=37734 RepID=A0AAW8UQ56_ENTCA|nr:MULTISPECIES: type II toxin-antitoxin system death-on-curing family toxin [Enterococcus]EGO5983921.1 type II toxin-antitoxin system death-on-curing family toxin [Enterococcus faecalis]MBO0427395.1 type II toxin-antitoxin system death-on-curing family toxin [Enterococcus faecium]EGO8780285.1 type II toxin-antitoxin system death-on-curing family toxin [Enterococcus faecalis]EHV2895041.1 type II toxin-antitoxin system death-on-curing family toxin [Enterococcus faecalis]EIT1981344.1 type II tox